MVTYVVVCGRFGLGWRKRRSTTCFERSNEHALERVSVPQANASSSTEGELNGNNRPVAGAMLTKHVMDEQGMQYKHVHGATDSQNEAPSAERVDGFANADS